MRADLQLALVVVIAIIPALATCWNSHHFWMLRADIRYFISSRHTEVRQWVYEMRWWWLGVTKFAKPLVVQLRSWPRFRSVEWNRSYENTLQLARYDLNHWTDGKPPARPEVYVPSWCAWRGAPGYLARSETMQLLND